MSNTDTLNKQFMLLENFCGGNLGVSACHIETQHEVHFHQQKKFLMCSTYKLPMAILFLQKVAVGDLTLNQYYDVADYDLRPGIASTLNQLDYTVPQKISLINLLQLMLQESCNTASDIILRIIGSPSAVTQFLRQNNINNMRIDRYTIEIMAAMDGIKQLPPDNKCTLSQYKELELSVTEDERAKARENFLQDEKDTTTPNDMILLLIKLAKNEFLSAAITEKLLKIMRGCKRGQQRIMGLLPLKTLVAHKTGTATGFTCDVGIITLPHEMGHIALSTYIAKSNKNLDNNERVLAEVGRTVYDYFLFND